MMDVIAPMQFLTLSRVLEQDNKFHLITTATLGIDLTDNQTLLSFDHIKDAIECMGDSPAFDLGMPKPRGEYLVSGSFYAPNKTKVEAGEVKVSVGEQEKSLYVFGERTWQLGIPSKPALFDSLPLDYHSAFGGADFPDNPDGIGYQQQVLPRIESPTNLVSSPTAYVEPIGLSPIDPFNPRRSKFLGSYGDEYLEKYFPGYPPDMDWRAFMAGQKDQWLSGFYEGDEAYELHNLHPDEPLLSGKLPNLLARCFIKRADSDLCEEIPLNLDTIWFFPEKKMALLIARGGIEVNDDEAEDYSHVMYAYERKEENRRSLAYYQEAFEKRLNSTDRMLHNLCTDDLIPSDHKSAMELLQMLAQDAEITNAFADNLDSKKEKLESLIDLKSAEAIKASEAQLALANIPNDKKVNIHEILAPNKTNLETEELNKSLEDILPGITGKDGKNLDLKHFSFDKIDEITALMTSFANDKKDLADTQLKIELEKNKQEILKTMQSGSVSEKVIAELHKALEMIDALLNNETPKTKLPRVNAQEILTELNNTPSDLQSDLLQLQAMKSTSSNVKEIEKIEQDLKNQEVIRRQEIESKVKDAELRFQEGYLQAAHGMDEGLSPHIEAVDNVKFELVKRIKLNQPVSQCDWACLDLSGMDLSGVDFSGAYLEQVNFTQAKLVGTNFSGAILARAIFDNSDCSQAIFDDANVGLIQAHKANFSEASFIGSEISESDFTEANFTGANVENVNSLNIIINGANFTRANLPNMLFLELSISKAQFVEAKLDSAVFLNSNLNDVDFTNAVANKCVYTDISFTNVVFDHADLTGSCFVSAESEKCFMKGMSFVKAKLDKCNLQNMNMQGSNLSHASLEAACFMGADLSDSNLESINARGSNFRKAIFTNANLSDANFMEALLGKSKIVSASLVGANLFSADLLRSTINGSSFVDSNLDATLIKDWSPS